MIRWKEYYLVPDLDHTHVAEGYENVCEDCEMWGEQCEVCDAFVPLITDKYNVEEVEYGQIVLCGIPIGHAYEVSRTMSPKCWRKGDSYPYCNGADHPAEFAENDCMRCDWYR